MPNHKCINIRHLKVIYYLLYWISAVAFAISMIAINPKLEVDFAMDMYTLFLRIYVVLLAIVETFQVTINPVPKWSCCIFGVSLSGTVAYFISSFRYSQFNKGELYLLGAILLSFAYELKMLAIITQQGIRISTIIRAQKYRLIRLGLMAAGTLLFLSGTIITMLDQKVSWIAVCLYLLGGLSTGISGLFLLRKKDKVHVGYYQFETSMEIPSVV